MGFQFFHVETYARSAGKGKAGGHSLRSIVAEAERDPAACPHVEHPEPPTVVYGVTPSAAADLAEERAGQAVDAKGRKFRKDGLCMLAGVTSYPEPTADLADPEKRAAYEAWEKDAVGWLRDRYGDRLASVVRHEDEEFPHLHFYAVPELRADGRLCIEDVHEGRKAAKEVGGVKGDQNRAYKAAMRAVQDSYFQAVGVRHGLARLGPGKRRLTREGWQAEQAAVKAAATAIRKAEWAEGAYEDLRGKAAEVKGEASALRRSAAQSAEEAKRAADAAAARERAAIVAEERANRKLAKAETKAAKIVSEARKQAKAIMTEARAALDRAKGFGGWAQAVLDGMRGHSHERVAEAAAAAGAEKARQEEAARYALLERAMDSVSRQRDTLHNEAQSTRLALDDVKRRLAETQRENKRLAALVPKPKAAPTLAPSAGLSYGPRP